MPSPRGPKILERGRPDALVPITADETRLNPGYRFGGGGGGSCKKFLLFAVTLDLRRLRAPRRVPWTDYPPQ